MASEVAPASFPGVNGSVVWRGALWTLTCNVLSLLSITAVGILLVRWLGVTGRGEVAAAILVPTIVAYAGWLGLPVATGYWVSTRPVVRAEVVATARTLAVILSLILGAISLAIVAFFPVHESVRTPSMLFVPFIPLILFTSLQQSILQADLRNRALSLSRVSGAVAYVVLLVALRYVTDVTVVSAVLAQLGAIAIWFVLSSVLTARRPWFGWNREAATSLLGYGLRAHLGSMSPVDALRVDQLILAMFLSTYSLGLYVIAMTFVTANRVIGVSLGMVAFPVAARRAEDAGNRSSAILVWLVVATAGMGAIAAAVEIILGRELLRIVFDLESDEAYSVLTILVVGSIFMNLRQVASDILRGLGHPGIPSVSELVSLATICLAAYAFWDHGLVGISWAVTTSAGSALLFVVVAGLAMPSASAAGLTSFRRRMAWAPW